MINATIYEQQKLNGNKKIVFVLTLLIQVCFLFFFAIVGRFETSNDNILADYNTIIALSSTITISTLLIYGSFCINRFIVKDFVGSGKERIYLYPNGRLSLYHTKVIAFLKTYVKYIFVSAISGNMLFLCSELLFPIVLKQSFGLENIIYIIVIPLIIAIIAVCLIIISSFLGIRFSSTNATIVTSILLVTLLSNVVAFMLMTSIYLSCGVAIILCGVTYCGSKAIVKRLNRDDVIYK
ncbi:MAG: hypothetical protein R3Y24_11690 [Eubacteriales bacterium]